MKIHLIASNRRREALTELEFLDLNGKYGPPSIDEISSNHTGAIQPPSALSLTRLEDHRGD